jgi:hypothetical protein
MPYRPGMAAAGKKLNGHGARRKSRSAAPAVSDGGFGLPPHPTRVTAGQRFVARRPGRHRTLTVAASGSDGRCRARVEHSHQLVSLSVERLLAVRADGQGQHFQFLGFRARRYRTWAVIATVADRESELILPEWHPRRPVRLARRLVPSAARAGVWLRVGADLSASNPGRLNVSVAGLCEKPAHLTMPPGDGRAE